MQAFQKRFFAHRSAYFVIHYIDNSTRSKKQVSMPKISKKNKLLLIFLALAFSICMFTAFCLSNTIIKTNISSTSVAAQSFEICFLSRKKSQVKNETISFCKDYQKYDCAGFVWEENEYFYLVDSAYLNKNDALLMQNSLKLSGEESEIIFVKFPSYSLVGTFSNEPTEWQMHR